MFNSNTKNPNRDFPSHFVSSDALYFIPEESFNEINKIKNFKKFPVLQKDTQLLVLEHGIGPKAEWCKIKLVNNKVGYVLFKNTISPLNNTFPFYNVNSEAKFLPDISSPQINWKTQTPNIAYDDNYNGAIVIHYDLENVTEFSDHNGLRIHMNEARTKGLKLILDQYAFKYDESALNKLLNEYYLFCTAEDWFLDPRPCSTLKVAVAIPKRYLYAQSDLIHDTTGKVKPESTNKPPEPPPPNNIFTLKFENYDKYKSFFDSLIETLGRYNFHYVTKPWIVSPEGGVNLLFEVEQIKNFINLTNDLIAKNHPKNIVDETGKVIDLLLPTLAVKKWVGSLEFDIDKEKLVIKTIKYYSDAVQPKKNFSLMNGFAAYLNSLEVKNKTTINYLFKFDPETDFYDPVKDAIKSASDTISETTKSPLETLNKAEELFTGALKGLSGGKADEDLKNFLTTKHYPIITDIQPYPLDLFNCTADTLKRTEELIAIKSVEEKEKWKTIAKAYEKKKVKIESDYFTKAFARAGDTLSDSIAITDPNLRILLGLDELKGNSEIQKLIKYLTIANSINWSKYLGVAAQCLSAPLPPDVVSDLMSKYQDAKKFIDQIFSATVCNPYIKSGFKTINGLSLPTIEVYNPSQALANQLEAAFYKILTDLASALLKKSLQEAAKACASNPAQNFNDKKPSNPFNSSKSNNPFDTSTNEPSVDDTLDDLIKSISNLPNTPRTKQQVKDRLKDIINDVSTCLSLREMCFLYNGRKANDEVYQIIISLVKRKYGSPYSDLFATREQVHQFFKSLGNKIDLSYCDELEINPDASLEKNKNILCDDGKIEELRKNLLADHGLSPELIDEALKKLREEETKALEDVLKILNSPNPLDFSKVPNLACKVFPDGSSVAPSMDSFSDLIKGLTDHLYDNFDGEATEWHKTTYSLETPSAPQFLFFNSDSGKIEVNQNVSIEGKLADNVRANSGKDDKATQEKNSKPEDLLEVKFPAFIFKDALKNNKINVKLNSITSDNNPISYYTFLDATKQQKLDINFITSDLLIKVQNAEKSLSVFASKLIAQVAANFAESLIRFALTATQVGLSVTELKRKAQAQNLDLDDESLTNRIYVEHRILYDKLQPLGRLTFLIDLYLRKNQVDAESANFVLKDLYNYFNITNVQESNSIFAAENGSAIYFILGEMLFRRYNWPRIETIINTPSRSEDVKTVILNTSYNPSDNLEVLYNQALNDWNAVEKFYKAIFKIKIDYPDFDLNYQSGLNRLDVFTSASLGTIEAYNTNALYDLQSVNILKNKTNFIKFAEITKLNNNIYNFITGTLQVTSPPEMTKPNLFLNYLVNKMEKYGRGEKEIRATKQENFQSILNKPLDASLNGAPPQLPADLKAFEDINLRLFKHIKSRILSLENKFILLKDLKSPFITAVAESGSGIPYTKYLELVIPQNIQQKACDIRPHYLDIDTIKKEIIDEKSENMCVETIADRRTVGNKPINSEELKTIETTSTQDTILRGMYRLTVRVFLHDILLRGICLFGVFDPQSLRDEPAFITFMAKLAESEIRGIDNNFFIMLSNFFLRAYKLSNPEEIIKDENIKKSLLFKDLVKQELQNYVLPKLAKRINSDTNLKLLNDTPKDNAIRINHIEDEIIKTDILSIKGNSVYINTNLLVNNVTTNFGITVNDIVNLGPQKIYEDVGAPNNQDSNITYRKFKQEVDFDFLFKYIFPVTQTLNYFFMLNCLATSTRRQVVNSFMGTKKEVMQICKTVQANGQSIAQDPNNIQSAASDPMDIIIGELLKLLLTAPIKVLKGIAESSEPNIALISKGFKVARTFVPKLPSMIIPVASLPLGLFPTPITCPLPYVNPILAFTYFATFAWFDEANKKSPIDLLEEIVKSAEEEQQIDCSNIKNQDLYYLNEEEIPFGNYNPNIDATKQQLEYSAETISGELQRIIGSSNIVTLGNSSVLETRIENVSNTGLILLENEFLKEAENIFNKISSSTYDFNSISDFTYISRTYGGEKPYWTEKIENESISNFITDFKTKENIDYREYFIKLISTSMKEVEEKINRPPPPPTGSIFDDIAALGSNLLNGIFPQESGTFRLVKEETINSLRPYLMASTPALRIGSTFPTYKAAYDKAIAEAEITARQLVIDFAKNQREEMFLLLKQKLERFSDTDKEEIDRIYKNRNDDNKSVV